MIHQGRYISDIPNWTWQCVAPLDSLAPQGSWREFEGERVSEFRGSGGGEAYTFIFTNLQPKFIISFHFECQNNTSKRHLIEASCGVCFPLLRTGWGLIFIYFYHLIRMELCFFYLFTFFYGKKQLGMQWISQSRFLPLF